MTRSLRSVTLALLLALPALPTTAGERSGTNHTFTGNLTLDEAVQIALRQNPAILKAIQQIEVTRGQIIEVRAQALPHVSLNGSYNQQARSLI